MIKHQDALAVNRGQCGSCGLIVYSVLVRDEHNGRTWKACVPGGPNHYALHTCVTPASEPIGARA